MIVKIGSKGSSFKGLATYLTHDAEKSKSDERVAWTHTLNLTNDHVPSAVDEMLWTARQAELLKEEAGIRAGGRPSGPDVVKHVSLNWAPDEEPTREHMIETAEDFLRHMKWEEHQALLVAHQDKHPHAHLMINGIHPETGLKLNDSFEQRRAQAWALEYERENGRIYCEQRLLDPEQREDAPTRPAWMAFKNQQLKFENQEKALRELTPEISENPRDKNSEEWKRLKEFQKKERLDFFANGKLEFSDLRRSIYSEVREEFRDRWRDFYAAEKDGADEATLKGLKAELVADQKTLLEARRDEACQELRESRNTVYRELLDEQREQRHGLRARQGLELDNSLFFKAIEEKSDRREMSESFRNAADESTAPRVSSVWEMEESPPTSAARNSRDGIKSGADISASVGLGALSILGGIADGLVGAPPERKPLPPDQETSRASIFDGAFEEARQRQQTEREEAEREWYKKQRSAGE